MRFVIVAGALVLMAGTASAAYLVELDGGDRLTVDTYWEEGDRIHLMRDGVDLHVLRSRVRTLREVDDPQHGVASSPAPTATPARAAGKPTREELEAEQATIEKHLLRVQQERFEAANRGDPDEKQRRLQKEFERTQNRRRDVMRDLAR